MAGIWAELTDLVLPVECAGCRVVRVPLRHGVCGHCVEALEALRPRPARPTPAPPGLPPCVALGTYRGALREALLSYKERGRHGLARPLGRLLAEVVAAAVLDPVAAPPDGVTAAAAITGAAVAAGGPARGDGVRAAGGTPARSATGRRRGVLLVPVPATARAVRARRGDHLRRLTRHAAGRLRRTGWPVTVARPLRALPRPDSATLDSAGRAAAAASAFQLRPGGLPALRRAAERGMVVVLDDIVTTGVTLSAVTALLTGAGVPVHAAAVLAATARRQIG
jgi:predicted amidophosphoribosyltransferase